MSPRVQETLGCSDLGPIYTKRRRQCCDNGQFRLICFWRFFFFVQKMLVSMTIFSFEIPLLELRSRFLFRTLHSDEMKALGLQM